MTDGHVPRGSQIPALSGECRNAAIGRQTRMLAIAITESTALSSKRINSSETTRR